MSDVTGVVSRDEREQGWRERIERWASSGQSATVFAANEHVSVASLYQWRRRLRPGVGAEARPRFVPVRLAASPGVIEVVTNGGQVVRVGPDFDANHLRSVLATLEASSC